MPLTLLLFVSGSELERWRRAARGFEVVAATGWSDLLAHHEVDAGLLLFHLAERMGMAGARDQSLVYANPGRGPRFWVVSPRLSTASAGNAEQAITDIVLETLFALAGHEVEGRPIQVVACNADDLGGHSSLDVARRAQAVARGVESFASLFGG